MDLTTPAVEVKENMSYGSVKAETVTQEPFYDVADTKQQPVGIHTGENLAYGHIKL